MAANERRQSENDDSFDVSDKTNGKNRTLLLVGLIGGGAVLLTTCVCGLGIALFVFGNQGKQPDGSQPDEFVGTWKGRFSLRGKQRDIVYTFEKSGKFSEAELNAAGQVVGTTPGRWAVQNGQITIKFDGGISETANAVFRDRNTIDYQIVRHDQAIQVGLQTTFRRQ